jgi:alpha-tubulin suppressor-like RCC1 family protein
MNLVYEERDYNYSKKNDLFFYLKDNYKIYDSSIIKQYYTEIEGILDGINSCSGKIEQKLLHCLFYMFIIYFFVERNNKESQRINKKIKDIYANGSYLLSFADLAIINLFQGLNYQGSNCEIYITSEEPYSKSLMLFLMLYGDPRGRNNDSNAIMQLPLYKVLRKTRNIEKEKQEINLYFYEIYKSLEFFEKDKTRLKKENNITFYDYEKNIMNNIKNILKISDIDLNQEQNNNITNKTNDINSASTSLINNYINKDLFISQKVFNDEMLNIYKIPNNKFLSIEEYSDNLNNIILSKDFIIYFIKQIQIVLNSKYKLYDEKYINEVISEDVFNLNDEEKKPNFYEGRNHRTYNKSNTNIKEESQTSNEKEFTPSQLRKAFDQGKHLLELFINKNENKNKLNTSLNSKKSNINSANDEIMTKDKKENNENSETKNNKNKILFSHYLYTELLQKLSYRSNCPSGIVVSFGNNSHNETAHDDDYKIIKYPILVYKLKNIIIKKIYSGWEHNIIISDNNEIYSFGHNNNCQCGIPIENNNKDNIRIKNPINISDFNNGMTAISAACGNEHTLILDKKNNVYSFGNNEDGVLGVENNKLKSSKFIKVDFGEYNNRIKAISAGTVHNVALTDDGKIFSWGSAQGGQLGLSEKYLSKLNNKEFFISTPTLVPMKNNDMKIIKISCGEAHTIVLNNKKEVYSWGFGSNGQLGLGFCEDSFELGTGLSNSRIFTPKKIESFQKKILINDIQCGKTFSMFVDTNGKLYACGVNDLNQLGIPEPPPQTHLKNMDCQCKDFVIPTKLIYFTNMKVEKISCGEAHCVAIIKSTQNYDKIIWSWGNNRYGQLGLGDNINCSFPKPNTYLFEYKDNKYESVSCGGFHSLCLINSNDNINWIEDDFKNIICKIINDIGII